MTCMIERRGRGVASGKKGLIFFDIIYKETILTNTMHQRLNQRHEVVNLYDKCNDSVCQSHISNQISYTSTAHYTNHITSK